MIPEKSRIVVSTVGFLMGDSWTHLPGVVGLCKLGIHDVKLVCGTYGLPVWEWAQKNVVGADYEIVKVIEDPDVVEHPFCPGKGFLAITPALEHVRDLMPDETVKHCASFEGHSGSLALRDSSLLVDGDFTVVHPYTRHDWKNCRMVARDVIYSRPVKGIGLPGEYQPGTSWEMVSDFDFMVAAVLGSAGFVGVLSSFTNVATLFGKKQIIVSFTPDMPQVNPRAVKMVEPSLEELQAVVNEMGL